jgi:hypothetical protein
MTSDFKTAKHLVRNFIVTVKQLVAVTRDVPMIKADVSPLS